MGCRTSPALTWGYAKGPGISENVSEGAQAAFLEKEARHALKKERLAFLEHHGDAETALTTATHPVVPLWGRWAVGR